MYANKLTYGTLASAQAFQKPVFIGHRNANLPLAKKLEAALGKVGKSSYLYENDINLKDDVLTKIKRTIADAGAFVGIVSEDTPDAVPWILTEFGMAVTRSIPLVLLIESSAFPNGFGPLQGRENLFRYEKGKEDEAIHKVVSALMREDVREKVKKTNELLVIGLIALVAIALAK